MSDNLKDKVEDLVKTVKDVVEAHSAEEDDRAAITKSRTSCSGSAPIRIRSGR